MNQHPFAKEAYATYYDRLYCYTYTLTYNIDAAQDLVSETFLRMLLKEKIFKKYKNLFSALKRTALNILRNKSKNVEFLSFEDFCLLYYSSAQDVEKILLETQCHINLIAAFQKMDKDNQRIILLRYFYDLTLVDIAEVTNVKYSTLLYRHQIALRELRTILTGNGDRESIPDFGVHPKSKFYMFLLYMLYLLR